MVCSHCGANSDRGTSAIFVHLPHPHIARRKARAPSAVNDVRPRANLLQKINAFLAVKITNAVGTMWCAYAFALLAVISLPEAMHGGTATLVSWVAQTFLQLVLLSIIIVGQKVTGEASDRRAVDTYNDAEAVLHEAVQIQQHLTAQDRLLNDLVEAGRRVESDTR